MAAAGFMTAYISPESSDQLRGLAALHDPDGSPLIDAVCLFAGNYAADAPPYLRANNNNPPTTQPLNDNIQAVLDDGSVKVLQEAGIKVLLTVMNGWAPVGWSEFTNEADALAFAQYLKDDVVDAYGLDGIDIDDEYSIGTPNSTSLAMVTTLMRHLMPDALITKALFDDIDAFSGSWSGRTLGENLDHGWEMSYGGDPESRLAPYDVYMPKGRLSLGFWTGQPSGDPSADVAWLEANGYEGAMAFQCESADDLQLLEQLAADWTSAP